MPQNRTNTVAARLTDREKKQLKRLEKKHDLTTSDTIRALILAAYRVAFGRKR